MVKSPLKIALVFCLYALAAPTVSTAQDAAQDDMKAARLFRRCATCHSLEEGGPNKVGPNLFGVFDRGIAAAEGYRYSDALLSLGGGWTDEAIDQFLLSPRTYVRGTKMAFAGVRKTSDRQLLIAWLKKQTARADTEAPNPDAETEETPESSEDPDMALLPAGTGRLETFDNCAGCHSIKLVVQQGMDKDGWTETIEWMVDEQGMDPIEDDLSDTIASYLALHFGTDRPNFPQ